MDSLTWFLNLAVQFVSCKNWVWLGFYVGLEPIIVFLQNFLLCISHVPCGEYSSSFLTYPQHQITASLFFVPPPQWTFEHELYMLSKGFPFSHQISTIPIKFRITWRSIHFTVHLCTYLASYGFCSSGCFWIETDPTSDTMLYLYVGEHIKPKQPCGETFYSATITLVPPVTLVLHGLLPLHPLYNIPVLLHNMFNIEPCFSIGHNLSLICLMTSEDIKHQLIIIIFTICDSWCTLSCDFVLHNWWNIQMALITAHFNAGVILVVTE